MKRSLLALFLFLSFSASYAASEDTAYVRVVTERAGKIVATLSLPDSAQFYRVRTLVANQYVDLNAIYSDRDEKLKNAAADSLKRVIRQDADSKVEQLHGVYLKRLASVLDQQQIDKVKDGMTYGVVEVTYKAYQEKYPTLTDEQKKYILNALVEAREHAMDGGSSKEKHAWFGKYKGRINNYLSSQGIK